MTCDSSGQPGWRPPGLGRRPQVPTVTRGLRPTNLGSARASRRIDSPPLSARERLSSTLRRSELLHACRPANPPRPTPRSVNRSARCPSNFYSKAAPPAGTPGPGTTSAARARIGSPWEACHPERREGGAGADGWDTPHACPQAPVMRTHRMRVYGRRDFASARARLARRLGCVLKPGARGLLIARPTRVGGTPRAWQGHPRRGDGKI